MLVAHDAALALGLEVTFLGDADREVTFRARSPRPVSRAECARLSGLVRAAVDERIGFVSEHSGPQASAAHVA